MGLLNILTNTIVSNRVSGEVGGEVPVPNSATVENSDSDALVLVFDGAETIDYADFIIEADGGAVTTTGVLSGNGTATITLSLSRAIEYDETLSVNEVSITNNVLSPAQNGQEYLENNAYLFNDYSQLTISDGNPVVNGNAGLVDQSGNGHASVIVGAPVVDDVLINSANRRGVLSGSGTGLSAGYDGDTIVTTDVNGFEIHWSGSWSDGIAGAGGTYLNFYGSVGGGSAIHGRIFNSGQLQFRVRTPTGGNYSDWDASGFVADGAATVVLQIRYDFVTEAISVWMNGSPVAGTMGGVTAMSAQVPSSYNNDQNLFIGAFNSAGSPVGNNTGATLTTVRFAATPLLTDTQRANVLAHFQFQGE